MTIEKEREASVEEEQLMKKVKDLIEKVRDFEATCAKVEEVVVSLKTTYEIVVRQLAEAKDAAKKSLEA